MLSSTVTAMLSDQSLNRRFMVMFDGGAMVDAVGYHDATKDTFYARSDRTGQWYFVQRTGSKIRGGMVRVRVYPARDANRADDTVLFPTEDSFGGWTHPDVFTRAQLS